MKRILAFIVCILMLLPASVAEIDISGLSYDELVALKDRINLAIWNSKEWQEVTVPQGLYKVGEDIPAGHWNICCTQDPNAVNCRIEIGTQLNEAGTDFVHNRQYHIYGVWNPNNSYVQKHESDEITFVDINLEDGQYVLIGNAPAVFTPYAGKPSLGFK